MCIELKKKMYIRFALWEYKDVSFDLVRVIQNLYQEQVSGLDRRQRWAKKAKKTYIPSDR